MFFTGALRNLNHIYGSRDVVGWWGLATLLVAVLVIAAATPTTWGPGRQGMLSKEIYILPLKKVLPVGTPDSRDNRWA
ncbi:hypothetical protein SB659_17525 [Arthrobacter sp. SIMBA_036]|uniref:hypothetical protein n=1 Tax=Arthrobacter sp. SIMBA_036 TaxID=3085778 RepID=UPI00397DE168